MNVEIFFYLRFVHGNFIPLDETFVQNRNSESNLICPSPVCHVDLDVLLEQGLTWENYAYRPLDSEVPKNEN